MNKILVENGRIIKEEENTFKIKENTITIDTEGTYFVEYLNTKNLSIKYIINSDYVNLVEVSKGNIMTSSITYEIKSGSLLVNKFYNINKVNEEISVNLLEINSSFTYYFSSIASNISKYKYNINHMNKNTISKVYNRAVALTDSNIDFIINSSVYKEGIDSNLDQNTRIVTMGNSNCSVSPNMLINLADSVAKHGSVIGTFKEEEIFYLMSRGISYKDSLKLLIKGCLLSNMIFNMDIRKMIIDALDMYWR